MYRTARLIHHTVLAARQVLLIPHQHPDGDALGSLTAFAEWLRQRERPYRIFCATPAAAKFRYLPHLEELTADPALWRSEAFDCVVVFDSGDLRYAGVADFLAALPKKPTLINIDHHATNELYGDLNLVTIKASSTAEVLYHFFVANGVVITNRMATSLLTGLMTDTDHFTNAATTTAALHAASALLNKGGNLPLIRGSNFKDKSVNSLKLWGRVLGRVEKHPALDIVYSYLTLQDLADFRASETESEGISNFFNNVEEGRASILLKELPGTAWKGSFRTTRPDVDVSAYAKALGGGGHKKAAGCTVSGSQEEAFKKIFETIARVDGVH